ncbi:hypothetical protein ACTUM7_01295 [Basfia succiniciproducens]|uniref:hypothetical protein n=1 Tax=Basfia succiniciproducens TaxID=653940 RepID=UPI003FCE0CFE
MYIKYLSTTPNHPLHDIIAAHIQEIGKDPWGSTNMYVGISYNDEIYCRVACEGLTEWVGFENFLFKLNATKQEPVPKGYDSVFHLPKVD